MTSTQLQQKASAIVPALSPLSILRTLWKHKSLIFVIWVGVSVATYFYVKRIPSVYVAEAAVLVDSPKIPDRLVSSTVVTDPQDRVAAISLQILTNGQLQKIIQDFNLYEEERQTEYMEDVLKKMRKDIVVTPERSWAGRPFSFRISYQGRDAKVVADVANRLANLYVQENHKARTSQAAGTSQFIETQLDEAKQKLDQMEAAVSKYEQQHNGQLPKQENSLNATLNRLTVQLEANKDAINRAQQSKIALQDSLALAESLERTRARRTTAADRSAPQSTGSAPRILRPSEQLQAQLNDALLKYTSEHPEVKRLRGLLAQAKSAEAAAGEPAVPVTRTESPVVSAAPKPVEDDPAESAEARTRIAGIKSNLSQVELELANREADQRRILAQIAENQGRVAGIPLREQEMAQLTRDYDTAKANYRSLLDKKFSAQMATEMEVDRISEQFTVADPAEEPMRAAKPNRRMLYAGGWIFGLALGLALAFGLELHKATLLGEWELPAGIAVLGRLPVIRIEPSQSESGPSGKGGLLKSALLPSALITLLGTVALGFYFLTQRF